MHEVANLRSLSRRKVYGVERRAALRVGACPVEDASLLIYLSTLHVPVVVRTAHLHAGRSDELLLSRCAVDAVEVAVRVDAVEHVVLGDAERHVIAAYSADSSARLVGIVGDTKLCAFSVAGEEHTVHLVVCRNSRLCSPQTEVGEVRNVLALARRSVVQIVVHHVLLAIVSDYIEAVAHHRTACVGVHIVIDEQLVDVD